MLHLSDMDQIKKAEIINKFALFKDLSPAELSVIAQATSEQTLPEHTIFIEQEAVSDVAYFICSGGARVYRVTEQGEEVTLAMVGVGDIVGEMSILDDEPRSACVETIHNTKVLILTRSAFNKILIDYPEVAISLLKTMSKRMRETNEHVEDILSKNLSERTWKILQNLANYFPNKDITLSQEELAGIIGATRARVTEILNSLQKQGKIRLAHRQIRIN